MLGEWLSVYLTSRHGSWRIYSASPWTERFKLFVLIVLGESLVAVGVGAGEHPLTIPLLLAAGLGGRARDLPVVALLRSRGGGHGATRCRVGGHRTYPHRL
ncbi:low temperature requirement protein A [Propionibacterium freudenreichii]|nr:low temperature requirement protein A [Propionibacterium freudenreichii]MDK9359725.1 low temperature requirement protein A [Propionibacterium freudenreichii]MDK9640208.1 low temperature requirement protein A [Propionibacterium freudenreichii]